jgi:arabinan endo-1,5-alpha-L-arabinosidase
MTKIFRLLICIVWLSLSGFGEEPRISVHDPVLIKQGETYYLFSTGIGIRVWSSPDLKIWKAENPVFPDPPRWAVDSVQGFRGHIWAPDISFHNDQYYLYYSVSAFGKNTSCIGLVTNKTLNPEDPEFKWVDHGKVIQSYPGKTNWNAIDPNLVYDELGIPWLIFGSFWDGLQIVQLNKQLTGVAYGKLPTTLASRKSELKIKNLSTLDNNLLDAGGNAIEAPFVFRKQNSYFLFASIDYCCKGNNSTYKMIVGRSNNVSGPYLDREGNPLRTGGGTILMTGNGDWHGVGHNAVLSNEDADLLIFHAYDANDNGRSKLRIFKLSWDKDGWPQPEKSIY